MITKSVRTLSGVVRLRIPTDLSEVTLSAMIAMQSVAEDSNEIPLIPGLDRQTVDNIIDFKDLIDIRERILSLAHQIQYCYNSKNIPTHITIGTRRNRWGRTVPNKIKVITNLSIEPAGAFLSSRDLIADEINKHIQIYGEDKWQENFVPSLDVCASILANYFYCTVTGELWNEQKAEVFKSEVLKLSIQDALPIARFFFLNYNNLFKPKTSLYQAFRQKLKSNLALRRLKNSHISTP